MNKIYSVIWNTAKRCWVVASELASKNGGSTPAKSVGSHIKLKTETRLPTLSCLHVALSQLGGHKIIAVTAVPLFLNLAVAPAVLAADGIYINDGKDNGCAFARDGSYGQSTGSVCAPQTVQLKPIVHYFTTRTGSLRAAPLHLLRSVINYL